MLAEQALVARKYAEVREAQRRRRASRSAPWPRPRPTRRSCPPKAAAAQDRIALDQKLIEQLPEMLLAAAEALRGANLTVLDGADGLSTVVSSLADQGMALFESIRTGLGPHAGEPAPSSPPQRRELATNGSNSVPTASFGDCARMGLAVGGNRRPHVCRTPRQRRAGTVPGTLGTMSESVASDNQGFRVVVAEDGSVRAADLSAAGVRPGAVLRVVPEQRASGVRRGRSAGKLAGVLPPEAVEQWSRALDEDRAERTSALGPVDE